MTCLMGGVGALVEVETLQALLLLQGSIARGTDALLSAKTEGYHLRDQD